MITHFKVPVERIFSYIYFSIFEAFMTFPSRDPDFRTKEQISCMKKDSGGRSKIQELEWHRNKIVSSLPVCGSTRKAGIKWLDFFTI